VVLLLVGLGCSGWFGADACPLGSTREVHPVGSGGDRVFDDTELDVCVTSSGVRVGPHVERWADGHVAVEGRWADGKRDQTWTEWYPDGAFRSQTTWAAGIEQGVARRVGRDERIVELDLVGGAASDWRALPLGTPMPEWDGSDRIDGTRYRAHASDER
jgi:hypothetical protein